jgi:rubrerythrin
MKHWRLDDIAWEKFQPRNIDARIVGLVKAAAMVERNGLDYAVYLNNVFHQDPDFQAAADAWAVEEVQHGDALGRWASLADPGWDFAGAFERYRTGYQIPLAAETSVRGSRSGELIARCMVETGTSSYYTALAEATHEPVLEQICRLIAADEYRHFKLFYDHLRRYLQREDIGLLRRLRIAVGRITETEDDELAFAYHCSNHAAWVAYDHESCMAAYLGGALEYYRLPHIQRGMGMMLKSVGLPPRGTLSALMASLAWHVLQRRRRKFAAATSH